MKVMKELLAEVAWTGYLSLIFLLVYLQKKLFGEG